MSPYKIVIIMFKNGASSDLTRVISVFLYKHVFSSMAVLYTYVRSPPLKFDQIFMKFGLFTAHCLLGHTPTHNHTIFSRYKNNPNLGTIAKIYSFMSSKFTQLSEVPAD